MNYPYVKDKTQYRSAIWYMNAAQEETATLVVDSIRSSKESNDKTVYVDIEPVTRFYKAE
jgi:peptide methionine sulfoxide reductase MsrA